MSNLIRWHDEHRMLPLLLIASIVILLAIAAAVIWSRGSLLGDDTHLASRKALQTAYDRVRPGRTSQSELASLGFDSSRYRSRILSGLGVQEYFMPRTSEEYDRLDPAVQACFEAPDRCRAMVFPLAPARPPQGFMSANAAPRAGQGSGGRMVFLLHNGLVAYKAVEGG
jgi:hypothetical protein